jgi:rhodanese-related sulfurtransferase
VWWVALRALASLPPIRLLQLFMERLWAVYSLIYLNQKIKKTMFDSLKNLLGIKTTDYAKLAKEGAIILDVRSKGEYNSGHISGSMHIALDQLNANLHLLKNKETPIITCCASGMRSASAKSILKAKGYKEVYNGGGWTSLERKI